MTNREVMECRDGYEYGYKLGFEDGRAARGVGADYDHGTMMAGYDAYSIGYRYGLKS